MTIQGPLTPQEIAILETLQDPDVPQEKTTFGANGYVEEDIMKLLLAEPAVIEKMAQLIKPKMFERTAFQIAASVVLDHFKQYGTHPAKAIVMREVKKRLAEKNEDVQVNLVGQISLCYADYLPLDSRPYVENQIYEFSQRQLLKHSFSKLLDDMKQAKTPDLPSIVATLQKMQELTATDSKGKRAYTLEELDNLPPVQWHIDGHFPVGGFVVTFGPFGVGKSFYSLDQALSIASGKPFLGRYAVQQGPVAYIAAEGHTGIAKRVRAWQKAHKVDIPVGNFILLPDVYDFVNDKDAATAVAQLAKSKSGTHPRAVFIDTLARNFGGDENSTKDMNAYVAAVASLGQLCGGATVVSVHHTGKDFTKGARGATALGAACDSMMEISGDPTHGVNVACTKQKDSAPFDPYICHGQVVTPKPGESSIVFTFTGVKKDMDMAEVQSALGKQDAELLAVVPQLSPAEVNKDTAVTQAWLEDKLGWKHPKVSRVLQRCREKNEVSWKRLGGKGNNVPTIYWKE